MVYGVLAEEALDKTGEIFDYTRSKPHFERWTKSFAEVTKGKSAGNLRRMHTPHVSGHFTEITFNDADRRVEVAAKVTDDQDWAKVDAGDYTGFSIGGKYEDIWPDPVIPNAKRYEAIPAEGSLVDNPAMFGATFALVRADGAQELRKFKKADDPQAEEKPAEPAVEEKPATPETPEAEKPKDEAPPDTDAAPAAEPEKAAPAGEVKKDAGAVASAADSILAALKGLLQEYALMEGDPSTWTLESILSAIGSVLSVKYDAQSMQMQEQMASAMAMSAKIDDLVKAVATFNETIEKQITEHVIKALEPLTQVSQAVEGSIQKAVGETVTGAVKTASDELRKSLDAMDKRVVVCENRPAQAGTPARRVEKAVGGMPPADGRPALAEVQKFLAEAKASGKMSDQAMRELTLYAADRMMP